MLIAPSPLQLRRVPAIVFVFAFLSLVAVPGLGETRIAKIFGDNMVLQCGKPVPVWGTDTAGQHVTVRFAGQEQTTTANDEGHWSITLDPIEANSEPQSFTVAGSSNAQYTNVLVGEAWFCSGQSNMVMSVSRAADADKTIAQANHPRIRVANGQFGGWQSITPDNAGKVSATAYYFARELQSRLDVPIGLIVSAVGGTPIEAWTSEDGMVLRPAGKAFLEQRQRAIENYATAVANQEYAALLARWEQIAERYKSQGKLPPRKPTFRGAPKPGAPLSGNLFASKVKPSIPYTIRGVVWYQGEANCGRAEAYHDYLPSLIDDWRAKWNDGSLTFLVVQLPNFREHDEEPADSMWARLREAQAMTAAMDDLVEVAVTLDIGEANDIHPKNKSEVGRRLALIALGKVYGSDVPYRGPVMKSATVEGSCYIVRFDHADGGLKTVDGEGVRAFAIAGDDQVFHWAEGKIEGDMVKVSCDAVERPVALRYAWANNPAVNLTNATELPAAPFRTDNWPREKTRKRLDARSR